MESNKRSLLASAALNFGEVTNADHEDLTVPVNGAKVGQGVVISAPTLEAGLLASGFVATAGIVTIRLTNITAAPVDPAAATFNIALI